MHDYQIPSDELANLRDLYQKGGPLASLGALFQVDLILDANVVIGELRWATTRRQKPDARSALLEVLEAGTLRAWAPTFIEDEVEKHINVVVKHGATESDVAVHWQRLKRYVHLVDVGGVPENRGDFVDPKDVPYLRLQEQLEAGILSNDSDIRAMGGKAVRPFKILGALRAYSRASAVHLTLQVNGLKLGTFALTTIAKLVGATLRSLKKAARVTPRDVWPLVLLLASVILAIPEVRTWLRAQASRALGPLASQWSVVLELAQKLATEYRRIKSESDVAHASVLDHMEEFGKIGNTEASPSSYPYTNKRTTQL